MKLEVGNRKKAGNSQIRGLNFWKSNGSKGSKILKQMDMETQISKLTGFSKSISKREVYNYKHLH